jgi:hypothetical protein
MSRAAIIILLLVAVISVTLGAYLIVFPRVQAIHLSEAKGSLVTTGRLLQEMDVADEMRLVGKLSQLSRRSSLRDLLRAAPSDAQERQGWLNKLRAEVASLTTAVRGVAPVRDFFVLNEKGVGLVRNIDLHWTGKSPTGDPEFLKAINQAGSGRRKVLLVQEGPSLLRVVVVPVYAGARVIAVICATFPLDDGIAKARSGEMGLDVEFAYVTRTGVASGALSEEVWKSIEKFVKDKGVQLAKLLDGTSLSPQEFQGAAGRLLVAGAPVSAYGAEGRLGIILVRNVDTLGKPYGELALWLFGTGGICLVILVILVVIFGGSLARGLRQLEVDALEISSGEEVRRFKVKGPVLIKSVAELLNQILTRLQKEEPDEEKVEEEEPLAALAEEAKENEQDKDKDKEEVEEEAAAKPLEEFEEVEEVREVVEAVVSEADNTAPDAQAGVLEEAERELAAWEAVVGVEEEVGSLLGESVEESTAEVLLNDAARQMELERMQAAARQAMPEGVVGETADDEEDEDDEPPTRVADVEDLQAFREAAALREKLKLSRETEAKPSELPAKEKPEESIPKAVPSPQGVPETADELAPQKEETEEDRYYRDMYKEFVRAKQEVGEKVEKLNLGRFVRKLKKQEEVLKAKHGCKNVKFQVTVRNQQVSLRPRIIR